MFAKCCGPATSVAAAQRSGLLTLSASRRNKSGGGAKGAQQIAAARALS
jgi:hypothetical protein